MDIRSWLTNHQLTKFADAFEANEVTLDDLGHITHEDLRDGIGVKRFDERKQILLAIEGFLGEQERAARPVIYPEGLDADSMPTYLAHPWHALCAETHARVKLHWLTDTAELIVRWAVAVALAEILVAHDLIVPARIAKIIRDDIERPTLGRWLGILRELSSNPPKDARIDPRVFTLYEEEFAPRFESGNRGGTLETSLLMLRNQIAHGGGMSQEHASSLLAAHLPGLSGLLRAVLEATSSAEVVAVESGAASRLVGLVPEPIEPPPKVEMSRDGAWLVKDGDALPLLPLAIYEPVHMVDSAGELKDKPGGSVAQVFTRAYHDRLSYTPLGRDEAHSEVLEVDFFREVFRLDEQLDPQDAIQAIDGVRWDDAVKDARELAQDLIGRDDEIKTIKTWLTSRDPYDEEQPNLGWISGGPGLGKSMVMARVASDYASGKHRGFYFHKFGSGGNARSNRRMFLKLLESALYNWKPLQEITEPPDVTLDGDALIEAVTARLEAIDTLERKHPKAPRPAAWIIIDNFDEIIEQDPSFLDLVKKFALPGTVWLMCGRPEHGLDDEFSSGRAEHVFPGGLPVMSAPDIRAMLLEGMGNARYALLKRDEDDDEGEIHNAFIERVVEGARGLPLYVNLLLDDLRAGAITVDDDDKLPDGLGDYYDGLMERVGLSTVSRDLPMIVSLLARTEEPLDADALATLLSPLPEDIDIYKRRVRSALRVGQSLMKTTTTLEGTAGYSLYHQSFREYIGGRAATPDNPASPPASLIAEAVFEAERILYRGAEKWEELPEGNLKNHLFRWGTTYALDLQGDAGLDGARARLTSYAYLHSRLASLPPSAVIDLVAEYGQLVRRTPSGPDRDELMSWEAFFRERAHILARTEEGWPSTRIFLQLAIEHADNSPVTAAAEAWMARGGGADWLWLRRPTRPAKLKENFALRVFEGHQDRIEGVAILPEKRMLSWSVDHDLRVWNGETGEEIQTLAAHEGSVDGATLLDDGARAVSWSRDGGLIVWDLELGEESLRLEGHEKAVLGAARIDDERLISWSEDKSLRIWSLESGDQLEVMTGHTRPMRDAQLLDGNDQILTWSDDKSLRLWSTQGGDALVTMKGHTREVVGALVLGDDRVLSWDMDNMVRLWRISDGEALAAFEGHEDTVLGALQIEEDFLTWGKDNTIRRWSADGTLLSTMAGHKDWVDGLLMLSPTRAVSWSKDMNLILWNMETGKRMEKLEGHAGWVRGASVLATGELLSWSGGGTLRIWDIDAEAGDVDLLAVLEGHTAGVRGARELESGRLLSWSWDGSMRVWEWEKEEQISEAVGHRGWIHAHTGWGDARAMTWASDSLAVLWELATGHPAMVFQGHEKSVDGVIELSSGKLLTYSGDQTLRVWDQESGEVCCEMEGHDKKIQGAMELSGGGVLSWSSDATLKIWDPTDGSCTHVLGDHKKLIQGARELPDGRILSWSSDATLKVWSAQSGDLLLDMTDHKKLIKGARILDDSTALSWSSDKTLRVWDLDDGSCSMVLEGHKGLVLNARRIGKDRIVSIAKKDPMIVWDLAAGAELLRIETEEDADGATLLEDGTLLAWFRKAHEFGQWDLDTGERLTTISYEDAMIARPDLWQARQDAGRFDTMKGAWRSHGVSGGAILYLDRDGAKPIGIEWKDTGSWTNMLLTEEGVVTVHAGQYFHPLHLHLGTRRVTLAEAAAHLRADG